tara:strand:+ start:346 stop:507 length:162 start_codon:yes stop_codon:yes gene_type:complete
MLNNILKIQAIIFGVLIIIYMLGMLAYMGMDLEMMAMDYAFHESLHNGENESY